ncbi:hypothetical protein [Mycobacterium marinum]|uniref:hypothetical protein n=1 Tax=Mycobacterium marinum TaxID=1781 RepID=UPI0035683383
MIEADTVAHCGPTLIGEFARTLTMTDVVIGWTEKPLDPKQRLQVDPRGHRGVAGAVPVSRGDFRFGLWGRVHQS